MMRVPANRYVVFLLIACVGFAADLYSKSAVFLDLGYHDGTGFPLKRGEHKVFDHTPRLEGQSRPYLDKWVKFRLYTSFNEGALWGIGQGWTALFATLSVLACIGVLVWLFVFAAAQSRWLTVSLAFIMAGALGNLWDRMAFHGCENAKGELIYGVRDFLFFSFGGWNYPIFNLADAFLVTGAIMLIVQSIFWADVKESKKTETKQTEEKNSAAKNVPVKPATESSTR